MTTTKQHNWTKSQAGTDWNRKCQRALSLIEAHDGDGQEARTSASQCGEQIDSAQWSLADAEYARRAKLASA